MRLISSTDNPLIKETARLQTHKGRAEAQAVLCEGPHLLREALDAGAHLARVFFLGDWGRTAEGGELLGRAALSCGAAIELAPRVMAKLATTDTPPPVLAVVRLPMPVAAAGERPADVGLLLDDLQDPGNLGTILRTAWGTGARTILATSATVDFYAPKAIRAGQGAHFHLDLRKMPRDALLAAARAEGWWLVAAASSSSRTIWAAEMRRPCLICIGNEARGLDETILVAADERVAIPLRPGVDSLNAAVSAGVILFELMRRTAPIMGDGTAAGSQLSGNTRHNGRVGACLPPRSTV